jgi:glucosyl-3-phosphoglycerate synthase
VEPHVTQRDLKGSVRSYLPDELSTAAVAAAKVGHVVSVVIPAKDEGSTVAGVIEAIRPHLAGCGGGLIDEILVVDDGSSDDTARNAERAGATVLQLEGGGGKGAAMAAGVGSACGDLLVFLDADVENTSPDYIPRLLGPLVFDEDVMLVKGHYVRPIDGHPTGGGRVTELTARPALRLLFPALTDVLQPLAGETAMRREAVDKIGLDTGYRVEMGILIDTLRTFGPGSIAQVDLGVRLHRNRPIEELSEMATEVLAAALERSDLSTLR